MVIVQDLIFDLSIDSINKYILGETSQKEKEIQEKEKEWDLPEEERMKYRAKQKQKEASKFGNSSTFNF